MYNKVFVNLYLSVRGYLGSDLARQHASPACLMLKHADEMNYRAHVYIIRAVMFFVQFVRRLKIEEV